jgi:two-component system, NarL family, response regulator
MSKKKITVMVVDDHFVVRMGLCGSINIEPDMTVIAEASTGDRALALYRQHQPDIVLMDLRLPDTDGITACKQICEEFPKAAVVMLSTHDAEEDIYRAFQAGAQAYLLKTVQREELLRALRSVHAGERCIPPAIGARLAERMSHPELTARELDVLKLIAKGKSNKEIGSELSIAEVTVKLHVGHILAKLGASDRTQAATTALRRGILHLD